MPHHKILALDNLSLQEMDPDSELIPLMTPEDEEEMNNEALPEDIAILPLRNTVLFPGVVIPITAGRDKSIKLINDANAKGKIIGVVAQIDENEEDPSPSDVHHIGTVARIMRVLKMPDGNTTVILQGKKRFEIENFTQEEPILKLKLKRLRKNVQIKKM
jgi:ATP-dependent Lon protease